MKRAIITIAVGLSLFGARTANAGITGPLFLISECENACQDLQSRYITEADLARTKTKAQAFLTFGGKGIWNIDLFAYGKACDAADSLYDEVVARADRFLPLCRANCAKVPDFLDCV